MAKCYKLGGPNFAQDIIDGEAVIVNLEKGSYYSLDHSGARIWQLLSTGSSDREVLAELLQNHSGPAPEIETGLGELIEELEREGILALEKETPDEGNPAAVSTEGKPVFEKPLLQKFTDMEAILMLDPIHEVDAAGWPNAKPES